MIISGIGPLHLSGISDANLITFAQPAPNSKGTAEQKVTFLTDDKVLIVGTYYSPSSSNKNTSTDAIILLHMLARDRNDWNPFASTLSNSSNGHIGEEKVYDIFIPNAAATRQTLKRLGQNFDLMDTL